MKGKQFETRKADEITMIHQSKLKPFEEQPYRVVFDKSMEELIESIKENGILSPIIVRRLDNEQFEIISGHRRVAAGKVAKIHKFPAQIMELNDDEAAILLVDSNLQRENILPSEKAFAYKLKLDAMKRQGKRTDLTFSQNGTRLRSDAQLAEQVGESRNQVQRYIRLTYLIDKLLEMVDNKKMPLMVGVELSYLGSRAQAYIAEILEYDEIMLSMGQATKIKLLSKGGQLDEDKILAVIYEKKTEKVNITIKNKQIREYFPKEYSKEQIENIVFGLIKQWSKKHRRGRLCEKNLYIL